MDAKCRGAVVLDRSAQQCRHRGTGPDGEFWADAPFGIVRRSACRPVRPAAATYASAVVCSAGGARPGSADLPRSAQPGSAVAVYRGHWLRFRTDRTGLAGDSSLACPTRTDTGRVDFVQRLG